MNKKTNFFLTLLFLAISFNGKAQVVGTPYLPLAPKYRLGGNSIENANSLRKTADGGYISLNRTFSSDPSGDISEASRGSFDYWIVKLDASGRKVWDKRYGGLGVDQPYCIQQTTDGGYIIIGNTDSSVGGDISGTNKGGYDIWILKLDHLGNKQWDKLYGGDKYDYGHYIIQTSDGGYMATGTSVSSLSGDFPTSSRGSGDGYIFKLDSFGNKQWSNFLGGSREDGLNIIHQTSDGGYFLAGVSRSGISGDISQPSRGEGDFWAIKLNSSGTKEWDKRFGGSLNEYVNTNCAQLTPDGGYILAGSSESSNNGDVSGTNKGKSDYWIVKLDRFGNKLWDKMYGGPEEETPYAIQNTSDGGYILAGESKSSASSDVTGISNGMYDYWILKLDSSGNKQWDKLYGGAGNDRARNIEQTLSGGYIVTGHSDHASAKTGNQSDITSRGDSDIWILFLDANGNIIQP